MQDSTAALAEQVPDDLRDVWAELLRTAPVDGADDDIWSVAPLRDLPGYASDAAPGGLPTGFLDEAREAHHLGILHGWHLERGDVSAEDARLRGFLFGAWRDALSRSARTEGSRVTDRVAHAMRWMSWGRSNLSMARRAGRWSLAEYQRSLRWRTNAQGLAARFLIERFAPGKRALFDRVYDQLVLGLAQTTSGAAPSSKVHELLHCDRRDLLRAGVLDIQLAAVDAESAGLTRLATFCRAHARATEELHPDCDDPEESGPRTLRSRMPTQPAMKRAKRGTGST